MSLRLKALQGLITVLRGGRHAVALAGQMGIRETAVRLRQVQSRFLPDLQAYCTASFTG